MIYLKKISSQIFKNNFRPIDPTNSWLNLWYLSPFQRSQKLLQNCARISFPHVYIYIHPNHHEPNPRFDCTRIPTSAARGSCNTSLRIHTYTNAASNASPLAPIYLSLYSSHARTPVHVHPRENTSTSLSRPYKSLKRLLMPWCFGAFRSFLTDTWVTFDWCSRARVSLVKLSNDFTISSRPSRPTNQTSTNPAIEFSILGTSKQSTHENYALRAEYFPQNSQAFELFTHACLIYLYICLGE